MSLSTAELNSIIATENTWLTTVCSIYRAALVADGMGGFTESWTLLETTVCDFWESSGRTNENNSNANQTVAISEWFITLPYDTDITNADVIVIDSQYFDVVSVPDKQSLNSALRCIVISRNNFEL